MWTASCAACQPCRSWRLRRGSYRRRLRPTWRRGCRGSACGRPALAARAAFCAGRPDARWPFCHLAALPCPLLLFLRSFPCDWSITHAQPPVNATSGCLQQSWCSTSRQLQHKCRAGQLPSLLSCRQLVQHRRSSGQHGGDERRALRAGQVGGHPGQRLQPGRVLLQVWPLAGSRGGGAARAGGETAGGGGPVEEHSAA